MALSDKCLEKLVIPSPAYLRLERDDLPGESSVHGYLLQYSEEWLLVQVITDFRNDGFCLIRRSDLTDVRCQEYEVHYKSILEAEGVIPFTGPGFELDLSSSESAFRSLSAADQWVIVEREVPEDEYFVIGPVVRSGPRSLSVRHFDALGLWDATPTLIRHSTITKVVFGSDYLKVWQRHMPPMPVA